MRWARMSVSTRARPSREARDAAHRAVELALGDGALGQRVEGAGVRADDERVGGEARCPRKSLSSPAWRAVR